MSKRPHDCDTCEGKTRHENPPRCSTCREDERIDAALAALDPRDFASHWDEPSTQIIRPEGFEDSVDWGSL